MEAGGWVGNWDIYITWESIGNSGMCSTENVVTIIKGYDGIYKYVYIYIITLSPTV